MSAAVARTGGISLIVMAVAAALSYGYIHGSLVIGGDNAATVSNLQASSLLFRAEILGWVLIIACDIIAAIISCSEARTTGTVPAGSMAASIVYGNTGSCCFQPGYRLSAYRGQQSGRLRIHVRRAAGGGDAVSSGF